MKSTNFACTTKDFYLRLPGPAALSLFLHYQQVWSSEWCLAKAHVRWNLRMWVHLKIVHLVHGSSYQSRVVLRLLARVHTGRWISFAAVQPRAKDYQSRPITPDRLPQRAFLRCLASWVERLNFCCWSHPTCSHLSWESWERTKDLPGMWALFMWQDRWEQNFVLKCDLLILILHASPEKLFGGSVIKRRASKQRLQTHFSARVVEGNVY